MPEAQITTHPRTRWRSRRRRSNEKSARRIRQETPPYWQIHTEGGPFDGHPGMWVIRRLKEGYDLLVNGRPAVLPQTVRLQRDSVIVKVAYSHCNASGTTRATLWHFGIKAGARVDYRSGTVTRTDCLVLSDPFLLKGGMQWCTLIEGVRGWVAVEALTPVNKKA